MCVCVEGGGGERKMHRELVGARCLRFGGFVIFIRNFCEMELGKYIFATLFSSPFLPTFGCFRVPTYGTAILRASAVFRARTSECGNYTPRRRRVLTYTVIIFASFAAEGKSGERIVQSASSSAFFLLLNMYFIE